MNDLLKQFPVLYELFRDQGALSRVFPSYRTRGGQIELATTIAKAIVNSHILIAEAGTGTGKTLAYLLPALVLAKRCIISTATRALQDQLLYKDIEVVRKASRIAFIAVAFKGRSNYACLQRIERNAHETNFTSRQATKDFNEVLRFVQKTQDGDFAALGSVAEDSSIWPLVTSTKENCLGSDCPHYQDCFVMRARREAMQADVVITNHHLFFADLVLKTEGAGELLPRADLIVFDEAHQIPNTATHFLGSNVSVYQFIDFAKDLMIAGRTHANGLMDWIDACDVLMHRTQDVRIALGNELQKLGYEQALSKNNVVDAVVKLLDNCTSLIEQLNAFVELHSDFSHLQQRLSELKKLLEQWWGKPNANEVRWLETSSLSAKFIAAPLNVADKLSPLFYDNEKAWVFTSATLTLNNNFQYFASETGLNAEALQPRMQTLKVDSPFNFNEQAKLFIPTKLALPNHDQFTQQAIKLAVELAKHNHGGTFFLTTSLAAVRKAAAYLRSIPALDHQLFIQGEQSKQKLLENFSNTKRGFLIGSQSFWQGVDMSGNVLTLVIIDKLPFAPPDDPLVKARSTLVTSQHKNAFLDYALPQAAITLKQGVGRLLRHENDYGLLVICDKRLVQSGWGGQLLESLPPFGRVYGSAEAQDFLSKMGTLKRIQTDMQAYAELVTDV